jgi:hypothetical protein
MVADHQGGIVEPQVGAFNRHLMERIEIAGGQTGLAMSRADNIDIDFQVRK